MVRLSTSSNQVGIRESAMRTVKGPMLSTLIGLRFAVFNGEDLNGFVYLFPPGGSMFFISSGYGLYPTSLPQSIGRPT